MADSFHRTLDRAMERSHAFEISTARRSIQEADHHDSLVPVCPECRAGKHQNCDGTAWDPVSDAPTSCTCADGGHQ